MTLVLVAPGGGHAPLVAAAMAAASGKRGVSVNLGAINDSALVADAFADAVRRQLETTDLVVVYFEGAADDLPTVQRVHDAVRSLGIDLSMTLATGPDTDEAIRIVEELRDERKVEIDGLVIDDAPTDDKQLSELKEFVRTVTGVSVIGALPVGCAAMEPDDFQSHSVTWFD